MTERAERFVNRMRSAGHKCRVEACSTVVPLDMVMCKPHWRQVPRALQKAVSRTWGKASDLEGSVGDTKAYFRAVAAAVEAVDKAVARIEDELDIEGAKEALKGDPKVLKLEAGK